MMEHMIKRCKKDIDENRLKHEIKKQNYKRLVSFKSLPNDVLLPATRLSDLGFYYDHDSRTIRCSECLFQFDNLKTISYSDQLINYHYKFNANCVNIRLQEHDLKRYLESQREKSTNQSANEEKLSKFMSSRDTRLNTFNDLQIKGFKIESLVDDGLYFYRDPTLNSELLRIKCAYCAYNCIIFKNYHLNSNYEDPIEEHHVKYPNCPIVVDKSSTIKSNLANETQLMKSNKLNESVFTEILSILQEPTNIIRYSNEENIEMIKNVLKKSFSSIYNKPCHPKYATELARFESFKDWSVTMIQRPDELAKAGFYYYGCKDQVKCFFCNGMIRNWDPTDEPIWEHARWFPKCSYVRQLMGPKFLDEVRERYRDMDSALNDDLDDYSHYYVPIDEAKNMNNQSVHVSRASESDTDSVNTSAMASVEVRRLRDVSPRVLNSYLDLPVSRRLTSLGIKRSTVKEVLQRKLGEGDEFENPFDLARECVKHDQRMSLLEEQFKRNFHFFVTNMPFSVSNESLKQALLQHYNLKPSRICRLTDFNNILLVSLNDQDLANLDQIINGLNEKLTRIFDSDNEIVAYKIESNNIQSKHDEAEPMDTSSHNIVPQKHGSTSDDKSELINEIERLKKEHHCVICFDREKNIVFLPCSHRAACVQCSVSLVTCPICRGRVEATIRTF